MSELTKRVLFALLAAPFFITMISLGGLYFWVLMLLISLVTIWEVSELFKHANLKTNLLFALILSATWFISIYFESLMLLIPMIVLLIIIKETLTPPHNRILSILTTLFAGIYPTWGFISFYELRNWHSDENGLYLLLVVLVMIWGNDSFAYFGGKSFGKHKMAPEISPAKTWEGFISGFLGSAVVLACFVYFLGDKFSLQWFFLLPLVLIVSVFGPIGDLAESKLKRFSNKKDSSNLLPGHGGFFDRFDSVILVSPAVMLYLKIVEIVVK